MKKLLKEILIIVIVASAIAFAYNLFSSKPLPWTYKPKKILTVDDTELTIKKNDIVKIDTSAVNNEKPDIDTTIVESPVEQQKETITETIEPTEQEITAAEIELPAETDGIELKTLNYEQVLANLDNPDFLFIDARHKEDWEKEHIGNAINIMPPYEGNLNAYFTHLSVLPHDKIIVVYCTGGSCDASHRVASDLKAIGYTRVFLYSGGWDDWIKKRGKN